MLCGSGRPLPLHHVAIHWVNPLPITHPLSVPPVPSALPSGAMCVIVPCVLVMIFSFSASNTSTTTNSQTVRQKAGLRCTAPSNMHSHAASTQRGARGLIDTHPNSPDHQADSKP